MIYYYNSTIGRLLITIENDCVTGLKIESPNEQKSAYKPVIGTFCNFLDEYFKGNNPKTSFKILPKGTPFQLKVWQECSQIPYGKTATYKDIATKLSTSPRAVGNALNKNPILILIPCHRVIGSNNSLVGFAAGTQIKQKLLDLERKIDD